MLCAAAVGVIVDCSKSIVNIDHEPMLIHAFPIANIISERLAGLRTIWRSGERGTLPERHN